jgi:hypothetical protein
MKIRYHNYFLIAAGLVLLVFSACCEPKDKNSFPKVILNSYSDTSVKDADQFAEIDSAANPLDSAYYPVYSIDIQNTGSEADSFYLSYTRVRDGYQESLNVQQFVNAGETKTFTTIGPLPSNSPDTSRIKVFSFFVRSVDSIPIQVMRPQISIHYGQTPNGPGECGTSGKDITVDPLKLQHK